MSASVFSRLCHEVTELEHIERAMDHSALQLALAGVIVRLEALVDDTVGLEGALELDLDADVVRSGDEA